MRRTTVTVAVTALFAAAAVALMAVQTCGAAPTDAQLVVEAVLGGGRTSASRFVLNAANGRIESDDSFGAQKPSTGTAASQHGGAAFAAASASFSPPPAAPPALTPRLAPDEQLATMPLQPGWTPSATAASFATPPSAFRRPYSLAVPATGKVLLSVAPLTGQVFERYWAGPDVGWLFLRHDVPTSAGVQAVVSPLDASIALAVDGAGRVFRHSLADRVVVKADAARPAADVGGDTGDVPPQPQPLPPGPTATTGTGGEGGHTGPSRVLRRPSQLLQTQDGGLVFTHDPARCVGSPTDPEGCPAHIPPLYAVASDAAVRRGVLLDGRPVPAARATAPPAAHASATGNQWVDVSPGWNAVRDGGVQTPTGSLMFVTATGELAEYEWEPNQWRVASLYGRALDVRVVVDAFTLKGAAVFAINGTGALVERTPSTVWVPHGHPPGMPLALLPAVVIKDSTSVGSMFFRAQNGTLVEYWWSADAWAWQWVTHGTPPGTTIMTAPGAPVNRTAMFMVGADGNLHMRQWSSALNAWQWHNHGRPARAGPPTAGRRGADGGAVSLAFVRPVALTPNLVVTVLTNGDFADLELADDGSWVWRVHPTPESWATERHAVSGRIASRSRQLPGYVCDELHANTSVGANGSGDVPALPGPVDDDDDDDDDNNNADAAAAAAAALLGGDNDGCFPLARRIMEEEAPKKKKAKAKKKKKKKKKKRSSSAAAAAAGPLRSAVHPSLLPAAAATLSSELLPGPWKPSHPEELASSLVSAIAPSVFCVSLTGNVFERFNNDLEWVYVSHMNPSDQPVLALSTVRDGTGSFFASDLSGRLFKRTVDPESNFSRLTWVEVTRPGSLFFTGAAQSPQGLLYFVDAKGLILERNVLKDSWRLIAGGLRDDTTDVDPSSTTMALVVDAYTVKDKSLWTVTSDGSLMELEHCCGWTRHGHPPGSPLAQLPALTLKDLNALGSLFFRTVDHHLVEYWYNILTNRWEWIFHESPEGTGVASAPGALVTSRSWFVVGLNGRLYERRWRKTWRWVDHGHPKGSPLAAARPMHLSPALIVMYSRKGTLVGRVLLIGKLWKWEEYAVPLVAVRDLDKVSDPAEVASFCDTDPDSRFNCVKGKGAPAGK